MEESGSKGKKKKTSRSGSISLKKLRKEKELQEYLLDAYELEKIFDVRDRAEKREREGLRYID